MRKVPRKVLAEGFAEGSAEGYFRRLFWKAPAEGSQKVPGRFLQILAKLAPGRPAPRKVPRKVFAEGSAEGFCGRFCGRFPEGSPRKVENSIYLSRKIVIIDINNTIIRRVGHSMHMIATVLRCDKSSIKRAG